MTSPVTLTARTPEDLLAVVPHVLGFHPEDSLVLLTFGGAGSGFHARVDLPDDDIGRSEVAALLRDACARNAVDRCAVVAYADDHEQALAASEAVRVCLAVGSIEVLGCFRADGRHWFPLDPFADLDRVTGTAYDLASHPFTAESVFHGRVVLGDRESLVASFAPAEESERDRVRREADRFATRLLEGSGDDPAGVNDRICEEARWVAECVRAWVERPRPLSTAETARLAVLVSMVPVRDEAWAAIAQETARRHFDLWREVLRRVPDELVPAPAALAGFAAWLAGDGAMAWCAIDRCQAVDPAYSMGRLVAEALTRALPPSTWRPFSD